MAKKKTITTIIIIAALLLVVYLAVSIVVPRVMLHNMIQETLAGVGNGAEYYSNDKTIKLEQTITADNGHILIDIPSECVRQDNVFETTQLYKENNEHMVIMMKAEEFGSEMNLINPENFDSSDYKVKIGLDQLAKGFESFGNGLPDSAYGTYKCAYMLDKEDYNPMSLDNQVAYSVMGVLKVSLPQFGKLYVYEDEEICGFIHVNDRTDLADMSDYLVCLEIYTKDNLNKVTSIMVSTDNPEEAYAILDSARPVV